MHFPNDLLPGVRPASCLTQICSKNLVQENCLVHGPLFPDEGKNPWERQPSTSLRLSCCLRRKGLAPAFVDGEPSV
jgi:hypothetical protein